jgi:uncharacterized protein (DUF1778 family)
MSAGTVTPIRDGGDRLESVTLRMSTETKESISSAAAGQGKSLTTFIIDAAMKETAGIVERVYREIETPNRALYLTAREVRELSGYQMKSQQVMWLRKNGIHHYVRADGRPIVPLGATDPPKPGEPGPEKFKPDFDAVRVAPKPANASPAKSDAIDGLIRRQGR